MSETKRREGGGRAAAIAGTIAFLPLAPGSVAVLVPWALSDWQVAPPFFGLAALRYVGGALILAGLPLLLDSFARFALEGFGTPAPIYPTDRLIVSGLYRYVRNPMYVGVAAVIFGQALLLGSAVLLAYGAIIVLGLHLFVMAYEEPTLRRRYGAAYDTYCAAVGRWLPRVRRRREGRY